MAAHPTRRLRQTVPELLSGSAGQDVVSALPSPGISSPPPLPHNLMMSKPLLQVLITWGPIPFVA